VFVERVYVYIQVDEKARATPHGREGGKREGREDVVRLELERLVAERESTWLVLDMNF
jgi:hypothetical protein